jgi:type II secretory pathway pseudopilin PulG
VAAFSLVELMLVLGVAATIVTVSIPRFAASVDEFRAAGAARYMVARLQQARTRAIARNRDVALRITHGTRGYVVSTFEDDNRNGVLTQDIREGIDVPVGPAERLNDQFPGVDFGALPAIPGAEGSAPPGTDPIRLGAADAVTFTPVGTATAGSLYIRGRGAIQYVVRVYGETGRTRILKYNTRTRAWFTR